MIRAAIATDVDAIVAVLAAQWADHHDDPWNAEQARNTVAALIEAPHGVVFVVDRNGVAGVIGGACVPSPLSGVPISVEMFWVVSPSGRGFGISLLRAFEAWSRQQGARRCMASAPRPRVAMLLSRRQFKPAEISYGKTL